MVFASDSRTSAGPDNIAVFGKMMVWEVPDERVVVILSSGNLATTQSVIALLKMRARNQDGKALPGGILRMRQMYDVAELVGSTLCEVVNSEKSVRERGVDIDCSFIVGGQIDHKTPRLYRIYPEGNFIEATPQTNYFQIGETKYGKPIIDRVVKFDTPMKDVAKAFLVSFDSTMRSNLTVGLPDRPAALQAQLVPRRAEAPVSAGRQILLRDQRHLVGGIAQSVRRGAAGAVGGRAGGVGWVRASTRRCRHRVASAAQGYSITSATMSAVGRSKREAMCGRTLSIVRAGVSERGGGSM